MSGRLLITGASRGIGRATAILAAQNGFDVDVLGRDSSEQRSVLEQLRSFGSCARGNACDFSDRASVDRALEQLKQAQPYDVLIHNAAVVERATVSQQSDLQWERVLEINLTAPMRITRALLPTLLARGRGRIIFVSSISAVVGTHSQSAYNVSKAGIVAFMRCLAEELSDTALSTLALLPGGVDTDMLKGSGFQPKMTAEEVAQTLLFYAKDASRAHNGAAIEMFGS